MLASLWKSMTAKKEDNTLVRRSCLELSLSKRSRKRWDQKLVTNMQIPEHFTSLSIRLSEALDDSGAGKYTVMERRRTFVWRECMVTIASQLAGGNRECFSFWEPIGRTTTPGLNSDFDILLSDNDVNIMTDLGDWDAGTWLVNLLMLYTRPQQFLLQVMSDDTPEPETRLLQTPYVRKDAKQVLFSSERWKQDIEHGTKHLGEANKAGPSVSWVPNWDIVLAFYVRKPLPEIQHWINRCRGRHWPPVQLLDAAREAPSFLVPAGHPDSDYKREEWRLSPNLIERMLMFSFNMTQIKCYIVLKLIQKSLFFNIVGDSITSFHYKTIMFYTIERTHPTLWCEHNLMFLLRLCLHVLKNFLRLGRLPHYIIEGVNLFDGKLSKVKQTRLLVYIDSIIRNNLHDVFCIGIDKIGCRLQACGLLRIGQDGELGRACLRNSISLLLKFQCLVSFIYDIGVITYQTQNSYTTTKKYLKYRLRNCVDYSKNVRLKPVALEFSKHLYALQNSTHASNCLRLQDVVHNKTIRRFHYYLNTDVASSRLKLASLLYCSGHIRAAVTVLEDVERRFHSKVKVVCGWRHKKDDRDLHVFANMMSDDCGHGFSEPPFAFCVRFDRQEAYCAPYILWFEMIRHITEEEVSHRTVTQKQWMDNAEVDARPFLHYLQYLTYKGLGELDKQMYAMSVLVSYICDPINRKNLYHMETALNLLGHCYEMEGDYERALYYYEVSLHSRGTNNAANWHVQRLQRLISG